MTVSLGGGGLTCTAEPGIPGPVGAAPVSLQELLPACACACVLTPGCMLVGASALNELDASMWGG